MLDCILRMLHPIMPFLTEELYAELPVEKTTPHLIVTPWPEASALAGYRDEKAERIIDLACAVIGAIRSTRARYGVSPKTALKVSVKAPAEDVTLIEGQSALIKALANVESLEVSAAALKPAESSVILTAGVEVYVSLSGLVDFAAERARLEKELAKDRADVERLAKKLSNPGFLAKAAAEIVAKDTNRLNELTERVARLEAQIAELS